jgi:hypothetical protein
MASRYYSAVAQDTTLTSTITSSSTSITVGSTTGYPTSYPFIVALDYNTSTEELVSIVGVSGLTFTIGTTVGVANVSGRGYNGTSATAHNAGAAIRHVITAQDLTDAQTHYGLALSSGAHGVTGALATFLGNPTSANFASAISDETGSGPIVFATGPTISGPTFTGTITVGGSTGSSGQILSSTGTGAAWANASAGYSAPTLGSTSIPSGATVTTIAGLTLTSSVITSAINAQSGTSYTPVLSDNTSIITLSNASAIAVTIPPNSSVAYAVGTQLNFAQYGAGQVTISGGSGVTIVSTGATAATPKLRAQYASATAIQTSTNNWLIVGDIQ